MADDVKHELKLSQQLVMTPQLQMAIKLLATPTAELGAMLATITALEPGGLDDPDALAAPTAEEQDDHDDHGTPLWTFEVVRPAGITVTADVWITGEPPVARAAREALPHLRVNRAAEPDAIRNAGWFLRSLRQRAKTYEKVVGALVTLRPALAGPAPRIAAVPLRELAALVGMHESTMSRVAIGVRAATIHGPLAFAANKSTITLA